MSPAAKQGRQIVEPGAQTLTRGVQCADILRSPRYEINHVAGDPVQLRAAQRIEAHCSSRSPFRAGKCSTGCSVNAPAATAPPC